MSLTLSVPRRRVFQKKGKSNTNRPRWICSRNSKELRRVEIRRIRENGKKWKEMKSEGQEVLFLSPL